MNETIRLSPASAAGKPDTDRDKRKYNFMRNVLERLAGTGLDKRSDRNDIIDFVRGENVEDPTLFQHVLAGHLSETPMDGRWTYPGYKEFNTIARDIIDYDVEMTEKLPSKKSSDGAHGVKGQSAGKGKPRVHSKKSSDETDEERAIARESARKKEESIGKMRKQLADSEPGRREFAESLRRRLQTMFSEAFSNMSSGTSTSNITITKTRREGDRRQYSVVIPSDMLGSRRDMILSVERNKGEQAFRTFSFQPGPLLPRRY